MISYICTCKTTLFFKLIIMKIKATKKGFKLSKRFYVTWRTLAEAHLECIEIYKQLNINN